MVYIPKHWIQFLLNNDHERNQTDICLTDQTQALATGMCSQVWWCQCQFLATSPCASEIGLYSTVRVTECINLVAHWWCVVHGNLGLISRLCWCSLCITYKWGACWKLILPSGATHSCQVTYFLTDVAHVELVWVVLALCCFLQW